MIAAVRDDRTHLRYGRSDWDYTEGAGCWLVACSDLGPEEGGGSGAYHCDEELRTWRGSFGGGELYTATLWVRLGNPNLVTPPPAGGEAR